MTGVPSRGAVYVAVIGPGDDDDVTDEDTKNVTGEDTKIARQVGSLLAGRDAIVVCGGLTGVMAAACEGAAGSHGLTVGLLPGRDRDAGNPHLSVVLPTGMGELRNGLVVGVCDVVIAIGGSWGTLSEIGLAVRSEKPVILVGGWKVEDLPDQRAENLHRVDSAGQSIEDSAGQAVDMALRLAAVAKERGLP
jgi:uncharacterized protein (TIGR00725 family)